MQEKKTQRKKYTRPQIAKAGGFKESTGWIQGKWGLEIYLIFPRYL
ncbi:keywimysin-related RiPP [Thermobifida cellulosilytica]|nr:keywimysin-related RiPP [Thermobifida cellulosilytica]